jgi:hypothetical protein
VQVVSTTGTAITISLFNGTGSTQLMTTGSVTVPTNATSTVNLGWSLTPGTYRLAANGMTGSFIRENSGITYPIALSTFGQITGFFSAITGAVTTSASYYFMYNWSMTSGCPSARVAVSATVTPPPALTLSAASSTVCLGSASSTVSITSNLANFDSYVWSPATGVSGSSTAGYTFNPSVTTTYVLTASQSSGAQCTNSIEHTVTVSGLPTVVASASQTSQTLYILQ